MVIILAWAVYRLDRQFLALLERVSRQDRRINQVLFEATRTKKTKEKTETPTFVDLVPTKPNDDILCINCGRRFSLASGKCPFCGSPPKITGESYFIPDFPETK